MPRWPSSGPVPKHSTPEEGSLPWRRRPPGHVPYPWDGDPADGSPLPSRSSRVLSSSLRKRRLSTIWASEESSGELGPDSDPQTPEEESPVPASVTRRQQQWQEESPESWPRKVGLPGIQNTARKRSRNPKKLAAVVSPHPMLPQPQEVACDSWEQSLCLSTTEGMVRSQAGQGWWPAPLWGPSAPRWSIFVQLKPVHLFPLLPKILGAPCRLSHVPETRQDGWESQKAAHPHVPCNPCGLPSALASARGSQWSWSVSRRVPKPSAS